MLGLALLAIGLSPENRSMHERVIHPTGLSHGVDQDLQAHAAALLDHAHGFRGDFAGRDEVWGLSGTDDLAGWRFTVDRGCGLGAGWMVTAAGETVGYVKPDPEHGWLANHDRAGWNPKERPVGWAWLTSFDEACAYIALADREALGERGTAGRTDETRLAA